MAYVRVCGRSCAGDWPVRCVSKGDDFGKEARRLLSVVRITREVDGRQISEVQFNDNRWNGSESEAWILRQKEEI